MDLLSWLLFFWTRLVMAVIWIFLTPILAVWTILIFILSHGWALAIATTIIISVIVSLRYRHSSTINSKQSPVQPHLISLEVSKTLPVHPRNGWFLEEMCQGIRFFGRFFPALSPTPGSLIVAGSTLLDANPKRALQIALSASDISVWFGKVHGSVQVVTRPRHSISKLPVGKDSDVINITVQMSLTRFKKVLNIFQRRLSVWTEKYFSFLQGCIPSVSSYAVETLERSWHCDGKTLHLVSSPTQPSTLSYAWSFFIFSSIPNHKDVSLVTMVALPKSGSFYSTVECLSFQLCALREHVLMKELKMNMAVTSNSSPQSNQRLKTKTTSNLLESTHPTGTSTGVGTGTSTGAGTGTGTGAGTGTSTVAGTGTSTRTRSEEVQQVLQQPAPQPVLANPTGPHASIDQSYMNMTVELSENILSAAKATERDGWVVVGTSKDVFIMKKSPARGEHPVNCVKGSMKINVPPDFVLRAIMDPTNAIELDAMLKEVKVIEELSPTVHLLHLCYKSVWPSTARDFSVVNIIGRTDSETRIHAACSVVDPRIPEQRGFVRGNIIAGGYVIKDFPGNPESSHVTYITQVDLKGSVPSFVVNKITELQPQCVNELRCLVDAKYTNLRTNSQKMKEFEDKFPVYSVLQPSTQSEPTRDPENEESSETIVNMTEMEKEENNVEERDKTSGDGIPYIMTVAEAHSSVMSKDQSELEETYTVDEMSSGSDLEDKNCINEESRNGVTQKSEELLFEDVFDKNMEPSIPMSAMLKKLPRYHSDSNSSIDDMSMSRPRSSSLSDSLLEYPRTDNGIDFRTLGNQSAAKMLEEMFNVSELDLLNPATFTDQRGGWKYQGIEKDVIILKKKIPDSPFNSLIGRGLIDLPPQEVFNCVRNPNQRFTFDNMLKELHIVKQIEEGLYILHLHHETTQCFLKQSRDFCILVCERSEPNKKLITGSSIVVPECLPQPNVTRGRILTSGWVIEPCRKGEKMLTQVTYLVQVDIGGIPATLINFISRRQPLAVAYLRNYLQTTSLNFKKEKESDDSDDEDFPGPRLKL